MRKIITSKFIKENWFKICIIIILAFAVFVYWNNNRIKINLLEEEKIIREVRQNLLENCLFDAEDTKKSIQQSGLNNCKTTECIGQIKRGADEIFEKDKEECFRLYHQE